MNLLHSLVQLFTSLFSSKNPEVKRKNELKIYEQKLKELNFNVYKNGIIETAFADVLHLMHIHTTPFIALFETNIASDDPKIKQKAIEMLLMTALSSENQILYKNLCIENRKQELKKAENIQKEKENQKKQFDAVISEFESAQLSEREAGINRLERFVEICRFPYSQTLLKFDKEYVSNNTVYTPSFKEINAIDIVHMLMDFYFVSCGVTINKQTAQLILILQETKTGEPLSEEEVTETLTHLKKISSILRKYLSPYIILSLLKLIKRDPVFTAPISEPHNIYVKEYKERCVNQYIAQTQSIDTEIQNEHLQEKISLLFTNRKLEELLFYNNTSNQILQNLQTKSFLWITPLQIIKTFLSVYYTDQTKEVLHTLLTEGFFANTEAQSTFSSGVFACNGAQERLDNFENSFANDGNNASTIIQNALSAEKSKSSSVDIAKYVDKVNREAKIFIQAETTNFFTLYVKLTDIINDKKQVAPEIITNIKFLISAAKTKDPFEIMERQHATYERFIEIMKNYVILGTVERK